MFNKFTITQKFIFISGVLCSAIILLSVLNVIRLAIMADHIENIKETDIPLTKKITKLTEHQLEQEIYFEKAFRYAAALDRNNNKTKFESAIKRFNLHDNKVNLYVSNSLVLIEKQQLSDLEQSLNQELSFLHQQLTTIKIQHSQWSTNSRRVLSLLTQGKIEQAEQLSVDVDEGAELLTQEVIAALKKIENLTEHAIIELKAEEQNIIRDGIALTIAALLIAAAILWLLNKSLSVQLSLMATSVSNLSLGKLTERISSKNISKDLAIIVDNINALKSKLQGTMQHIHNSSMDLNHNSDQMNNLTSQVLANIEQQESEISMLASALEEMGATSTNIAQNAEQTQSATEGVSTFTTNSKTDMDNAMSSMQQLMTSNNKVADNIVNLEQQGQKITSVLDVIQGIAEQTNLLALNAAIEAARAGEQGRGFAVVADEVRTLAQRTQQATAEIEKMISAFNSETSAAVIAMHDSQDQAKIMIDTAEKSNENLTEISNSIVQINDMTMQIASAAEEQAVTVREVVVNLHSVSDLSVNNVDSSSQVSQQSAEIANVSESLQNDIAFFQLK